MKAVSRLPSKNEENQASDIEKEYREFLYLLSHEFEAPIRHLRFFANCLRQDVWENLDERSRNHMRLLENSANRANLMFDGLLKLYRIRKPGQITKASDCLKKASAKLYPEQVQRIKLSSNFDDSLELPTDQFEDVFFEIISNSLKFSKNLNVHLNIDATESPTDITLSFVDDGPGVEEKYHTEIFKAFRQLHGEGVYPGVGVGLAYCKKVLETVNGKITAQSVSDGGLCIKIIIPKTA